MCIDSELSLSKEIDESSDTSFTPLLHRYLKFDDEMTKVSADWRECYQLIEHYNDEQVLNKAKSFPFTKQFMLVLYWNQKLLTHYLLNITIVSK